MFVTKVDVFYSNTVTQMLHLGHGFQTRMRYDATLGYPLSYYNNMSQYQDHNAPQFLDSLEVIRTVEALIFRPLSKFFYLSRTRHALYSTQDRIQSFTAAGFTSP